MSAHEKQLARARAKREAARKAAARKQRWRKGVATVAIVAMVGGVGFLILDRLRQPDAPAIDEPTASPSLAEGACDPSAVPAPEPAATPVFSDPPTVRLDRDVQYRAIIETSCGRIVLDLDAQRSPKTVANFVALARRDYYDGVIFHRVINGFVIQAGDPTGTGAGDPGYTIEGELQAAQQDGYRRGTIAMANKGNDPNTASTQFFIVQTDEPPLQPNFASFGQVRRGMDVVDSIAAVQTDPQDKPLLPIYILDVRIEEVPGDGPSPAATRSPSDGGSPS